jgi:hypothetical protein
MLGAASTASAATIVYTFESIAPGSTTPLLGRAPDVGPATFLADFTSSPDASDFTVASFQPNPLFSGHSLFEPAFAGGNTLTVTLNQLVTSVSVDFAINNPGGTLFFTSSSGNTSVLATPQGGFFAGGTLSFSSATPFSAFTLSAGAQAPEFAIDDLTLTVPEPSTLLLLGAGGAAILRRRRASR